MQDLALLNELIDRAAAVAGSDYKLAQALNVGRSLVSDWRHGRKPCAVEEWALMASMAGLEADKWALRALVMRHEGTEKGDRLLKALGKGLLATGAVLASAGAHATVISSRAFDLVPQSLLDIPRCILLFNRNRINPDRQQPVFFRLL